ncbi:MAG: protein-tyrosine phosphatase family protein, partial [Chloroflexota bacterium]|nr:protein-tyrosine phosphatase family protein [Chloroflexota bacterium]
YWVVPGALLAGEYPGALQQADARRKLHALVEAGVTEFIDLTTVRELEPYKELLLEEAALIGVTASHARHPVDDMNVPQSHREMVAILDAMDVAVRADRLVYVHCWGGIGRTGTVVGCWLVRHGLSGEDALARLDTLWRAMEKAPSRVSSPETPAQFSYVRNWSESGR